MTPRSPIHPHLDHRKFPVVPPHPSVAIPYAAGTVTLAPGEVNGLLQLIWEQINRDVPGTSTELRVSPDPTNVAPVYFGQFMGKPLQRRGAQSIWDQGQSVWDGTPPPEGVSQWDKEYERPNKARPGELNAQNFGFFITPQGDPRVYRSTYPGGSNGIGNIQVFSEAPAKIHVEVYE
jgi:hypothetical protein